MRLSLLVICALSACTPPPASSVALPEMGRPDAARDEGIADAACDAVTPDAQVIDAMLDGAPTDVQVDGRPDAAPLDAGPPDMAPPPPLCETTGPTPLRRLTPEQYRNSVHALGLDPDGVALTAADGPIISQLAAERFVTAAEAVARRAEIPPCMPDDRACQQLRLTTWATDAFRRAPSEAELDWLGALFEAADGSDAERARVVLEVVLQSPQFLYRFEPAEAGVLTPEARAERLAFAMTDAPPAAGRPDADALAASAPGRAKLRRFLVHWAGLRQIGSKAEPFESGAAQAESMAFIDAMLDARFADLLTRRDVFLADPDVAALYGVAPDAVELPAGERAGVLTRLAFLAAHAGPVAQSPIQRGVFVREALLCQPLPPPPPTVDDSPIVRGGAGDDGQPRSVRDLTERRTGGGQCAACHQFINPPGYLFGHYDARGRFVREEQGIDRDGMPYVVPVDARSAVPGADLPVELADAVELSAALAESRIAHDCLVRHWLTFVYARPLTAADACDVADLQRQFFESGGQLSVLQTGLERLASMRLKGAP